jgi:hypothetical protein
VNVSMEKGGEERGGEVMGREETIGAILAIGAERGSVASGRSRRTKSIV